MKYILSLVFIFNICGLVALAQSPPPPPPPLIYKAPEKNELKEFVSEDEKFQISFPGVPKVTKQELPNGKNTNYRVYRQGSNSVVSVTEFKFNLEKSKEKIYETIRTIILKAPKTKIEAERHIQLNAISGEEFDVLSDYQYQKIRVFIVGNKMYEIRNDVTNWHIIGDKTKKEFFDETNRFFDSFKFLENI